MQDGRTQLADWMERRGLNQRETARQLDMNHTTLNQILSGRRSVGLAVAVRIEQSTGIPVEAWMPTKGGQSAQESLWSSRSSCGSGRNQTD